MSETKNFLVVYEDESLTKPITTIRKDAPTKVGTRNEIVIYVKNNSTYDIINIHFGTNDKDLTVSPSTIDIMKPFEVAKITLLWVPSIDRVMALNASINYEADIVKRAR